MSEVTGAKVLSNTRESLQTDVKKLEINRKCAQWKHVKH